MDPILSYQIWMNLPVETRQKLATVFGISKTGKTMVEYRASGNVVTSDGYTPDDLRAVTIEKLQTILKTEEVDFYALIETAVENIDAIADGTYEPTGEDVVEKKRAQKKRAQKKRAQKAK